MIRKFLFSSIGLSLIAAVVIIGGGIYLKKATEKSSNSVRAKIDLIAQESIKKALQNGQIDTSGWEEALLAVSSTSTTDDKIAELKDAYEKSDAETAPITATDRFSRELLEKYVDFKNKGGVIDENTTIRFVNELLTKDYGGPEGEKIYTITDIIVLDTDLPSELKKYANEMASAISRPAPVGYESEIAIVNHVYETDDASYLEKLPQNIARYTEARKIASQIAVPKNLVDAHLAFLNSLSAIIEGIKGMTYIDSDPIGAARLMLSYEDGIKSIDPALRVISSHLKNRNVEFSSFESGYLFLK